MSVLSNKSSIPRIIYYYQSFCGLEKVLENPKCTHIHISSVHFGYNPDGSPYIHINDKPPDDPCQDSMWKDTKRASELGIKIVLMIGGAGGGFTSLFSNFDVYYEMLVDTVKEHPWVTGFDLDIEETVDINNVKMMIYKILDDFGDDFIISMAPVIGSLQNNQPGMGGFSYKELLLSPEGSHIHYFNAQSYGSYSEDDYNSCIENGYPSEMVVFGMLSEQYNPSMLSVISNLSAKYKETFGGVFDWEYFNAKPTPESWSVNISKAIDKGKFQNYLQTWRDYFLGIVI